MSSILRAVVAVLFAVGWMFAAPGLAQTSEELDAPLKAVVSPTPEYGDAVKQYGEMGQVQVYAAVDKAGKVKVLSASGPMAPCTDLESPVVAAIQKAAMEAASKTAMEPPMRNGKPVEVNTFLKYRFNRPAVPPQGPGGNTPKMISAGVMNGKAKSLVKPVYPAVAGVNKVRGAVSVNVVVSETGEVLRAAAISGHPMLHRAAVDAACQATFNPTTLQGNRIMVDGVLTYNFVR